VNPAIIIALYSSKYGNYQHLITPAASIFMAKDVSFSKIPVTIYQSKWHHIPKDINLHHHYTKNLKFCTF
jgi:hypothetical protein